MQNKNHYYFFNFFRLCAALMVMICHARCEVFTTYTALAPDSQNLFTKIFFGSLSFTTESLAIFFILSGFLVGGVTLERFFSVTKNEPQEMKLDKLCNQFLYRRFIRIIPPLFFAILLCVLVRYIGGREFSWYDAILNLFGLQCVLASDFGGVYWSIAYEFWFYILIAGLGYWGCGKLKLLLGIVLITFSGLVFVKLNSIWFFILLFGTVLYFLRRTRIPDIIIPIAIIGLIISYLFNLLGAESHAINFPLKDYVNQNMPEWGTAVFMGLILLKVSQKCPQKALSKFMEHFGNKWAPMTYCLYITHFSVLELFKSLHGQYVHVNVLSICVYCLVCISCLVFAYFFYWVVELRIVSKLRI